MANVVTGARTSVSTIFGQIRYLEKIADKLYENNIRDDKDLEQLSKREFFEIVGRTTKRNRDIISSRLREVGIHLKT